MTKGYKQFFLQGKKSSSQEIGWDCSWGTQDGWLLAHRSRRDIRVLGVEALELVLAWDRKGDSCIQMEQHSVLGEPQDSVWLEHRVTVCKG